MYSLKNTSSQHKKSLLFCPTKFWNYVRAPLLYFIVLSFYDNNLLISSSKKKKKYFAVYLVRDF